MPPQPQHRHTSQSIARSPKPRLPCVHDKVDVYWADCERYFRGTLVKRVEHTPFHFFIHYEDDDYQQTDLNEVRWHHARGSFLSTGACCEESQETLRDDDFLRGDMYKHAALSGAASRQKGAGARSQTAMGAGRVIRRRKKSAARQGSVVRWPHSEDDCDDSQVLDSNTGGKGGAANSASYVLSDSLTDIGSNWQSEESLWNPEELPTNEKASKRRESGLLYDKLRTCTLESVSERRLPRRKEVPAKAHWKKLVLYEYCTGQGRGF